MTGNVRQTAPELTWGTLRVTCDNSPTCDGMGPQKAPEGTEDMKSIDNLREYVLTAPSICSTTRAILVGYIDGIDKEVEEAREREYRNGMEDGEMAAERDGWVRLPVDADGVPIHVGDVMEGYQLTIEVGGMSWDGESWSLVDVCGTRWHDCAAFSHHHAPTVEDVLREFGKRWDDPAHYAKGELVDTFAEKLRLAGEDA